MVLLKDEDVFLGLRLLENLRPDRDADFAEVGLVEEQHQVRDWPMPPPTEIEVTDETSDVSADRSRG
jgi:hypothetical protein